MSEKKKIDNEELNKISGGSLMKPPIVQTGMHCSNCDYSILWNGDYYLQTLDCPECGKHTLIGVDPYFKNS